MHLIALDAALKPNIFRQFGVDETAQQSYEHHFLARDVVRTRFQGALSNQKAFVGTRQSLLSDVDLEKSEYYHDYMRPLGQYHQVGLCISSVGEWSFGGISLLRGKTSGEFNRSEVEFLRALQPHVEQSLLLSSKLKELRSTLRDREVALDAYGIAVISLDAEGTVLQQSLAARNLLNTNEPLYLDGKRLRARVAAEESGEITMTHPRSTSLVREPDCSVFTSENRSRDLMNTAAINGFSFIKLVRLNANRLKLIQRAELRSEGCSSIVGSERIEVITHSRCHNDMHVKQFI